MLSLRPALRRPPRCSFRSPRSELRPFSTRSGEGDGGTRNSAGIPSPPGRRRVRRGPPGGTDGDARTDANETWRQEELRRISRGGALAPHPGQKGSEESWFEEMLEEEG
eukprot:CAMPEP_0194322682 /NCGR_PEP_ID=MMETSP0171-20130528/22215_1 /TAXON_ID=218684 /ORGANISM="Corethron pennatum, Strain L29A3" /LENGTH=108 /DNA_ID=CAMNT_0039081033 /DNA_START=59 /DNA_END=381 /DNA_ORIENTATION=-